MGNSSSSRSTTSAVPMRDSHVIERFASKSGFKPQSKHIGSKLPPLHVIKDSSTQTHESGSKVQSVIFSMGTLFILLSFFYFSVCYVIICSNYVQSLIVYSHYVKELLPLQDLHKIGLPEGRNIEIITEDGILLRGWHLMNPGEDLMHANALNETERNMYFDQTLANTERIVVYFHGNSETRGQGFRLRKIKQLAVYLNANVIAFDYRGFADSEGYPSEHGTHLDARAVVHYIDNIVRRYNPHATGYLSQSFDQESEVIEQAIDPSGKQEDSMFSTLLSLLQQRQKGNSTALPSDGYQVLNASMTAPASSDPYTSPAPARKSSQPHLFLYGHSLGAAVSTALAMEMSTLKPGALSGLIMDSPFTSLPEAIKDHPLTNPFRTFPYIFAAMVTNLQFKYSNMDRIQKVNAPILLIHGEEDIKINPSHSKLLFLHASNNTEAPANTTDPANYFGANMRTVEIRDRKGTVRGSQGVQNSAVCNYPVEWHLVRKAGHNEVYATREWLSLLPAFVRKSEEFAADHRGTC